MMLEHLILLVLACPPTAGLGPLSGSVGFVSLTQLQPDAKKASPLQRCPNDQDIARLRRAEGKPRWLVLALLGHPSAVYPHPDGVEEWAYPWHAACRVWFENGVCVRTFYTAGF